MEPLLAPSILAANFINLGAQIREVLAAGADWIHFDVMDNHYVPNLSFGPLVATAIRNAGIKAPLDVHLMVSPPDKLIDAFANAGASSITFHLDATSDPAACIRAIKQHRCQVGLAVNPNQALASIEPYLAHIDLLLIMGVEPGFGGQALLGNTLDKIEQAHALLTQTGRTIPIQVDGGVNSDNLSSLLAAGATCLVAGSAIFQADSPDAATRHFKTLMRQAVS